MDDSSLLVDNGYFPQAHLYFIIITSPCIILNPFAIFVIYVATPKQIGRYKKHLLIVQCLGTINDIVLSYFSFPIIAIPMTGGYTIGLFNDFGLSTEIQIIIGVTIGSLFLSSLLVALFQRQQAIAPIDHWTKLPIKLAHGIEILVIFHPIYLILPMLIYLESLIDQPKAAIDNIEFYPSLVKIIEHRGFFCFPPGTSFIGVPLLAYYFSIWAITFFLLIGAIIIALFIQQPWMSQKTLELQKKWIRNLGLQLLAILVMFLAPIFFWYMLAFGHRVDLAYYSPVPGMFLSFHSSVSTIVLLTCYDSYRHFIYNIMLFGIETGIKQRVQRFKKKSSDEKVNDTNQMPITTAWGSETRKDLGGQ